VGFARLFAGIRLVIGFVHGMKKDRWLPMAILKAFGGSIAGFVIGIILTFVIFYGSDA
jgi:hypothetical protein